MKKEFAVIAHLIPGNGGVFNVTVDGELIFSKHKVWRFPEPGELASLIREK
ncbi:Rdx family protein [bacterium]|nr:Rdx family protein [bacterium]